MSIEARLKTLLTERLTPIKKITPTVIDGLVTDIVKMINTPQAKKFGATVMTAEASMAGDKHSPFNQNEDLKDMAPKPKVI